jgi:hypothetical protein
MGTHEIRAYLTDLAIYKNVAALTQSGSTLAAFFSASSASIVGYIGLFTVHRP